MKIICLLILIVNFTLANAQLHLQGRIVDAQTNQPIPVATISVVSKNLFYPADNAGKFDIATDDLNGADSVGFSCIGYICKKVKAAEMQPDCLVKLSPMINMLQEVKIGYKLNEPIRVGSKLKSGFGTSSFNIQFNCLFGVTFCIF